LLAGALSVLVLLAAGVLLAVLAALTGQPSWAVTLAGLAGCFAVLLGAGGTVRLVPAAHFLTAGYLEVFAVLFVLGSLAGGLLWLVPPVRLLLTPAADPPARPAGVGRRLVRAVVGIGGSSALAGLAGALTAGYTGASQAGLDLTSLLVALGAVLLGGVSLLARGGGVAGTALAVYIVATFQFIALIHGWSSWLGTVLPALVAMLVGLVVTALLDRLRAPGD
jgi:ribose/xylose/arabinose/galactoside ABC-type transport system permease subunit